MRRATFYLLVLLSVPAMALAAKVYRSVDAQGHVRYSDTPSPGAQLINVADAGGSTPLTAATTAATAQATTQPTSSSDADQIIAQQRAQQAVRKDLTQARAEQCKQATATYQTSIQARRIYMTGKDGEREYLSDADADAMRAHQRLDMENLCKGAQ